MEVWTTIPLLRLTLQAAKSKHPTQRAASYGSTLGCRFKRVRTEMSASSRLSAELHQIPRPPEGAASPSQQLYDTDAAFQLGVDAPSRQAVDSLRRVRGKGVQTDEEWEQCRETAVKYMLHEIDHLFGTLRARAGSSRSSKVLVFYHGDCEWLSRISTAFPEVWGVPYSDVEVEWVSL